MGSRVLEFVHRDSNADVLVVTNMWPNEERPVYGIYNQRQVQSLRDAGVGVDVLYLAGYRSQFAYPLAALRFALATVAWRGRYRLVHVFAGEAALAARFYVGPAMIATYWGDDVLGTRRLDGTVPAVSRVRARLVREHARLFSATITQSREMDEALPRVVRRRNEIMPGLGLDDAMFRPMARSEARARLGWSENQKVVLFAATKPDSPAKRLWLAEAACERAAEVLGDVRLHIARSVPPAEMPIVLNAADCLIHTSAVEGGPIVIKEAVMCNVPVVATDVGDAAESLEGVFPSFICAPDPAELGRAVIECVRNPQRSNGREARAAWMSSTATTRALLDVYERVAKKPIRRDLQPSPTTRSSRQAHGVRGGLE